MRCLPLLLWGGLLSAGAGMSASSGPVPPQEGSDPAVSALASIRAVDLLADVRWLSDPRRGGRLPGTAGYDSAVAWAVARLAALGLRPGGDGGGWRQRLPIEVNQVRSLGLTLRRPGRAGWRCRPGDDFVARGFSGSGTAAAPVVFVGYGLSLPDQGYDDYLGQDVRGKVVLALKQPPSWRPTRGDWGDAHLPRPKAAAAAAHGAVGLLLVSLSDSVQGGLPIGSVLDGPGAQVDGVPQLHVSVAVAESLFAGAPGTLAQARRAIDAARRPASRALPGAVEMAVAADYEPSSTTANVVGLWPGRDPMLAAEAVMIGAHLDHVGAQGDSLLFPGANDNASGVAALLAIARAFALDGPARRTVVFALFAGEETGLVGARWHALHPAVPLARTIAMLNLDCVAHGDSVQLGNGLASPRLWGLARELDAAGAHVTVAPTWGGGGADATPFHEAGVPALYFATTHSYTHLHRPSDRSETLNGPLHEALTRLAYRVARQAADGGYARETVTSSH